MRFHATDTKIFEFKHPGITETMYCLLNRDRTAQWQQLKVSFTLPESNLFSKSYSVANSHPKCASGFFTERTFMVQMFSSPTTSCKTVKGSLGTPQSFKKYLCSLKRHQERWFWTTVITWRFDLQNSANLKQKFKQQKESHSANFRSEVCSR